MGLEMRGERRRLRTKGAAHEVSETSNRLLRARLSPRGGLSGLSGAAFFAHNGLLGSPGLSDTFHFYFWTFVALVAAGFGFPIPEEIPVITGGAFVGHPENHLRWWIMLPLCIAGVVISDGLLYGIGRWWGPNLLEYRWIKTRVLPPQRREQIENNFRQYGVKILLFARFLPAIRSPIFITAGIMRLKFTHFLLADSIYAVPGVSFLFFLGYWFTDQLKDLLGGVERVRSIAVLVAIGLVAAYLFYHFLRSPVVTGDPQEMPLIGPRVAGKSEILPAPGDNHIHGTASSPGSGPVESGSRSGESEQGKQSR